jgi:hypothetical protein
MIEVINIKKLSTSGKEEIMLAIKPFILNTLCQNEIEPDFFNYLLNSNKSKKSDYLFVSYDKINHTFKKSSRKRYSISTKLSSSMKYRKKTTKRKDTSFIRNNNRNNSSNLGSIRGFGLVQKIKDYYYIHILCRGISKNGLRYSSIKDSGGDLLKEISSHAINNGINTIKLNALPNVILYYKRFGYKLSTKEQTEAMDNFAELLKNSRFENNFYEFLEEYNTEYDKKEPINQYYNIMIRGNPKKHAGTATKIESDGILMTLNLK